MTAEAWKLCASCGLNKPHRKRGDSDTLRASCNDCQADYGRRWRQERWQLRKLRDTWKGMIARCHDPSTRRWHPGTGVPSYRDYGARGIRVCLRWRESFHAFCLDVGEPPTPEHTLDRIRSGKSPYTKNNCRWATPQEQSDNREFPTAKWITATNPLTGAEEVYSVRGWARVLSMHPSTLRKRLARGIPFEEAISVPQPAVLEACPF